MVTIFLYITHVRIFLVKPYYSLGSKLEKNEGYKLWKGPFLWFTHKKKTTTWQVYLILCNFFGIFSAYWKFKWLTLCRACCIILCIIIKINSDNFWIQGQCWKMIKFERKKIVYKNLCIRIYQEFDADIFLYDGWKVGLMFMQIKLFYFI